MGLALSCAGSIPSPHGLVAAVTTTTAHPGCGPHTGSRALEAPLRRKSQLESKAPLYVGCWLCRRRPVEWSHGCCELDASNELLAILEPHVRLFILGCRLLQPTRPQPPIRSITHALRSIDGDRSQPNRSQQNLIPNGIFNRIPSPRVHPI